MRSIICWRCTVTDYYVHIRILWAAYAVFIDFVTPPYTVHYTKLDKNYDDDYDACVAMLIEIRLQYVYDLHYGHYV